MAVVERTAVAFSPDGRWIAADKGDKGLQVWDGNTGDRVGNAMAHNAHVYSAAFSRDGQKWSRAMAMAPCGCGIAHRVKRWPGPLPPMKFATRYSP